MASNLIAMASNLVASCYVLVAMPLLLVAGCDWLSAEDSMVTLGGSKSFSTHRGRQLVCLEVLLGRALLSHWSTCK